MAVQLTPREFGSVINRGGPGKEGQRGGWGFECAFCENADNNKRAGRTHRSCDLALMNHVVAKHSHVDAVADIIRANNEKHPNGAAQLGGRS